MRRLLAEMIKRHHRQGTAGVCLEASDTYSRLCEKSAVWILLLNLGVLFSKKSSTYLSQTFFLLQVDRSQTRLSRHLANRDLTMDQLVQGVEVPDQPNRYNQGLQM